MFLPWRASSRYEYDASLARRVGKDAQPGRHVLVLQRILRCCPHEDFYKALAEPKPRARASAHERIESWLRAAWSRRKGRVVPIPTKTGRQPQMSGAVIVTCIGIPDSYRKQACPQAIGLVASQNVTLRSRTFGKTRLSGQQNPRRAPEVLGFISPRFYQVLGFKS
jgi:hypothetical protein